MNPLISVLIPAYQAEKTILRCLSSISKQTNDNFEVVVIDDGSTDETLTICRMFERNKRFRIYTQTNMGVAATRQRLLELAIGKYIQFVDADDWIESNMIGMLDSILQYQNYDIIISDFILHNFSGSKYTSQEPSSLTADALIKDISSPRMLGVLWNKLIRKELICSLKFPNLRYCEDWCICVSLFEKADSIMYNKHAFYHYDNTVIDNSLTRNINKDSFKNRIAYIEHLQSIGFDKSYPKEYDSQVANIAYTAIVNNIYSEKEFLQLVRNISFWNNYNPVYKRSILLLTTVFSLSFVKYIDSIIRKLMHKL